MHLKHCVSFLPLTQQSLGSVGISLLPLETEMLFSVLCVAGRCVAQARRPPGGCKLCANLPSPLALHFTPVAR